MGGRASTISTQLGGKNSTLKGSNGAQTRRVTFTSESVKDPAQLVRQLNDLQQMILDVVGVANSAPITSSCTIQNVTFTAGQTQNIQHTLGRNPNGWFCVRAITGDATFREATLPSGLTRDKYVAIRAANAGTYDFYFY